MSVFSSYKRYDKQALIAHKLLGLRLNKWQSGFRVGCGFHRRWLKRYLESALGQGCQVALLAQERGPDGRIRRRLVKLLKGNMENKPRQALSDKPDKELL